MQDKVQEEIIADFEMFDDPDDRLQYLIDMADECNQIDERHKTEQYFGIENLSDPPNTAPSSM